MKKIKIPIIPVHQTFVKVKGEKHELDDKAICIFSALGFFLDTDTYWKDKKVLAPATINTIDDEGYLVNSENWFNWYYEPKKKSLEETINEFSILFEKIVKEQSEKKKIILPLSGGLDSRSQAVALKKIGAEVSTYSYYFQNGYKESSISKKIAEKCDFPFKEFTIQKGYLWNKIKDLANINNCYSEFTHPRQMAVIDEIAQLGNAFSLGHWGDVLFDSTHYKEQLSDIELLPILKNKIIKKGGLELASLLWKSWSIDGDFETYLDNRILKLLSKINISNTNAKIRTFKSVYWAPRWTSINLSIFENKHELLLPYYDDRMCKFICEVSEEFLADRKIQIEYIKENNPDVAKVIWQDAKPFHLFNHHLAKTNYRLPYRVVNKTKRVFNVLLGKKYIQRNWELQFLGDDNKYQLESYLFDTIFNKWISKNVAKKVYQKFNNSDKVYYSHAISTLLTLSVFYKKNKEYVEN